MFCILVVVVRLSVLAKWLARRTPLRKPILVKEIIYTKPRPKSAYDFSTFVHFLVGLCLFVLSYGPTLYISYSCGTVWLVCAESAVKHQSKNQPSPLRVWGIMHCLLSVGISVCVSVSGITPEGDEVLDETFCVVASGISVQCSWHCWLGDRKGVRWSGL